MTDILADINLTALILTSIFFWSSCLVLCVFSARAGAADRIRNDGKYSFKKLYEKRDQKAV